MSIQAAIILTAHLLLVYARKNVGIEPCNLLWSDTVIVRLVWISTPSQQSLACLLLHAGSRSTALTLDSQLGFLRCSCVLSSNPIEGIQGTAPFVPKRVMRLAQHSGTSHGHPK